MPMGLPAAVMSWLRVADWTGLLLTGDAQWYWPLQQVELLQPIMQRGNISISVLLAATALQQTFTKQLPAVDGACVASAPDCCLAL